jgi:hypothetical protein
MLSYYKNYLEQIQKKVLKIDRQLDNKYNKYNQLGGKLLTEPITSMKNKVTQINETVEKLEKLFPYMKRYKRRINDLITRINEVHDSGGDHINGGLDSTKLNEMMANLDKMNNDIVSLLNKETFRIHSDKEIHSNILIKPSKDSWEDILIIYRILISDFNKVHSQSKSVKLHEIYDNVITNIKKNSVELDELEKAINLYEIEIRSKINILIDNMDVTFDKNYIAYAKEYINPDEFKIKLTFGEELLSPVGADYTILKDMTDQLIEHYYNTSLDITINTSNSAYNPINDVAQNERNAIKIDSYYKKINQNKENRININNPQPSNEDDTEQQSPQELVEPVKSTRSPSSQNNNNVEQVHSGGNQLDHEKETQSIILVKKDLVELSRKFETINIKIGTSQELHNSFEQYRIRYSYYLMYLIMIMTKNQMSQEQLIYKYMDKETVKFYYNIIKDILQKIENMDKTEIILFFSTYHYFTLVKTKHLCKFLIENLSDTKILDVFNSASELLIHLTVFNNFKDILESYHDNYLK